MFFKDLAKKSRILRLLVRRYRLKKYQPSWKYLLKKDELLWEKSLKTATKGPNVLLPTSVGAYLSGTTLESLLAVALTLRGVEVHVLLCDGILPACFECWIGWYSNEKKFLKYGPQGLLCNDCFLPAYRLFTSLGVKVYRYSDFLSQSELHELDSLSSLISFEDIGDYFLDGIAIGEHAMAGALRFYARGDLDDEPYAEHVLRRYFKASLITAYVMRRFLDKENYISSVFHHGIYVPQGLIGEVCRQKKVPVVNWNPGYRKNTFIFSHYDTYHHTMITESLDNWINIQWNDVLDIKLMTYLKSRWKGSQDWIWFHEKPSFDLEKIEKEINIDFSKPCIGMLTSVMWDARLHYPSTAFPSMLDWVLQTIQYFKKRPDLQLIIRIHPAEIRGTLPSRQKIMDEIKKRYPTLPQNIFIIPPESRISTYVLMLQCDTVIIYNTKTGIELAAMGIPVIVAGEAWIRNKGFAMEVDNSKSYYELLDRLPLNKRMSSEDILKAKKYAYHFFFRRMIPLEFMKPTGGNPPYRIQLESLKDLLPGKTIGLDIICDGILKGSDFIYPAEFLT
ncbi:glycosyltransferase family 4 protein [Thermosulfuriphilus ammonigenes]|uniref:Glycosyltransferase family 4 protein n=1 Tax=Thermosulfuriphilus ammonigenes TaxID=1936021 RepID=A0A6G7PXD5_9BACT|nr:glycosyltransferase family 4 protein [Thermosulfuriphilus ammonigenes]MBA2849539.1 hypothetical protein [Thermosulfuriphilus ammonigenes]QIJ72355.1 glycosyltransferase family 4 protein [Thermosulfuriphilus ammonigenes]